MQVSNVQFALTIVAAVAVAGKTFVGFDGATAAAGSAALGVALEDAVAGEAVAVARSAGSALVTAGEALAAGDAVQVGDAGKAVKATTGHVVGYVAPGNAAAADGAVIEVLF